MLKIEALATPMGFTTPWQHCRARILCSYSALFLGTLAAHQPSSGSPMMTGPTCFAGPIDCNNQQDTHETFDETHQNIHELH